MPVYNVFDTAPGVHVFVGIVTDTQWRDFAVPLSFKTC